MGTYFNFKKFIAYIKRQMIVLDLHVLLKHTELPLVAAQGRYFPAHVLDREVRSPLISQNRNPFPSPHLQVQVLMNVPVKI